MSAVDFNSETFSVLREEPERPSAEYDDYPFPDWDILKEIDRREKRRQFDQRRDAAKSKTRQYIGAHPERVEEIRQKHGL